MTRMSLEKQQIKDFAAEILTMDRLLLRKCIVELIGTFFLMFVIGCVLRKPMCPSARSPSGQP